MEEMETRRKRKMGLGYGGKSHVTFLSPRGNPTGLMDSGSGWANGPVDQRWGPEGPAHARPTIVVGRPRLSPNGPQLGLGDRWAHI